MKKSLLTALFGLLVVGATFGAQESAFAYESYCQGPSMARNQRGTFAYEDGGAAQAAQWRGLRTDQWCFDTAYPGPCLADGRDPDGSQWIHASAGNMCYSFYPARVARQVGCVGPSLARNRWGTRASQNFNTQRAAQSRGLSPQNWCVDIAYPGPCLADGRDPNGAQWVHGFDGYQCYSMYPVTAW